MTEKSCFTVLILSLEVSFETLDVTLCKDFHVLRFYVALLCVTL